MTPVSVCASNGASYLKSVPLLTMFWEPELPTPEALNTVLCSRTTEPPAMVMGLLMVLLPKAPASEGPPQYNVPAPVFWIKVPELLAVIRLLVTRQSPVPSNSNTCTTPPPD